MGNDDAVRHWERSSNVSTAMVFVGLLATIGVLVCLGMSCAGIELRRQKRLERKELRAAETYQGYDNGEGLVPFAFFEYGC